jgi:hypothetical protein
MNKEQELNHYRKVLERIRGWDYTSKGSCDILRGFARKALEDVDKSCIDCQRDPLDLTCVRCSRNINPQGQGERYDYFQASSAQETD